MDWSSDYEIFVKLTDKVGSGWKTEQIKAVITWNVTIWPNGAPIISRSFAVCHII